MRDKTTRTAKRSKPQKPRVDPFLHQEALDRAFIVVQLMCSLLEYHPYINSNKKVHAAYIKACNMAGDLHQLIGAQDAS